ncbi:hypothetical protein V6N13_028458 [Hibiscus sabdariffa]|uniref:Uncharacterized protein n=1 Tax=Hibiscus sabdariffa TaxID=183260 RepID=A0ABR2DAC1_9ROSI
MEEVDWIVEVDGQVETMVDSETEREHWMKRSIYRIPTNFTDLNKKAYRPQVVSFGPYHHGEDHLMPMEEHKQRALLHFLRRSRRPLELFVEALAKDLQKLKDCYDLLDDQKWHDDDQFLQLMILDGCFMLEILCSANHTREDYAENDPVFSNHGKIHIIPFIKRDMLMLENQLPIHVLYSLVAVESNGTKVVSGLWTILLNHCWFLFCFAVSSELMQDEEYVNNLVLKFCSPNAPLSCFGSCLHILEVYRKSLLHDVPDSCRQQRKHRRRPRVPHHEDGDDIIRSAMELNEAGIWFKKSKTDSLKDITFRGGVLKLPLIIVDDATESLFLNLIAFERLHVGAGNEVTSYIFFMDNIIDSSKDVALLHSAGIIQNALGSDKAVAKMFNSLSEDITLDPENNLDEVRKMVNRYCKKAWNEWRANLIHTYFRNPWAILSLIAVIFLFALTIVQTVYTILSVYEN